MTADRARVHTNIFRLVLIPCLFTFLLAIPSSVRANVDRSLQVNTVAHGVEVSLIVPRSIYPRGVLTRVIVRVHNLSRQTLTVVPGFGDPNCAIDNPHVQSVTPNGIVRYPPAIPLIPGAPGKACVGGGSTMQGFVAYAPLRPRASEQAYVLVILRARFIRAVVALAPLGPRNWMGRSFTVVGRALRVQLTHAPPARIVRCSTSYKCLRVLPPPGAHISGPLYSASSIECKDARGNVAYGQDAQFGPTVGTVFHLGCGAPIAELHVVAGWVDHPVASIDWVR